MLIGSRVLSNGNDAVSALSSLPETRGTADTVQIDVCDDASVDRAVATVSSAYGRLDILVNNAAINPASSFAGIAPASPAPREVMRSVMDTNVTGAVSATEAFLPLLRESSSPRLVFVSSSTGSLSNTARPGSYWHRVGRVEYRASKAALNFVMLQYHLALKESGFVVAAADPGLCATNLTGDAESLRSRGAAEPEVGAERIAAVVRGDRDDDAGKVCGDYGDYNVCPW